MKLTGIFRRWWNSALGLSRETPAETAYGLWSEKYDAQPDNLMLALDEEVFSDLVENVQFGGKKVLDLGCGTGRHWKKLMALQPAGLVGFDVSEGMLKVLKRKFPGSDARLLNGHLLTGIADKSQDIFVSTLTVAHIEDLESAFMEWERVLKPASDIIITDFHPDLLAKGGKRTFSHEGKAIAIKNYLHPVGKLRSLALKYRYTEVQYIEKVIDESLRKHYEKQKGLHVFEKFKGSPVIYGIHFRRGHAPE